MSYTDKKITQAEINAHHVQGATDYLIGNPQQNKAVFDNLPEFIAGKFNDLIDEIAGQHGDEIRETVNEWLDEHPEATTTVQDNSLTTPKYVDGSVTGPKIADGSVTPSKLDRTYTTPSDLNVLEARMDEFASLPEGSTSGNAELVDIRVGANGTTYSTAGDAVRGQIAALRNDLGVKSSLGRPTDLNTVTSRGVYNLFNQTATNGYTNAPSTWAVGTDAILFVDAGNVPGTVWQIFIDIAGNVSTRRYAGSAWTTWNKSDADLEATVEVVKEGLYPIGNLIANSYADGFSSGVFRNYNGFSRTDYIPCDGFDSLYFDGYTASMEPYCCFYDSNKTFVSTFASRSKQGGNITIPRTASFVVVSAQTSTMQTVKASFRLLRARKDVNGGNWIFIGDSYLDGYTPDGSVVSWGAKLADFMGLDSDKYVIRAKGGAGFYSQSEGINFQTLLQAVNTFEKDSVTNIVVCGGYNDNTQTAPNIYNAVIAFLNKAKELYPSAMVSIGMVGHNSTSPGIRNNLRYNSLFAYQQGAGNATNARYLPLVEYALNDTLMSSDGIHPNANGQVQIAIAAKNALMGSAGLFYYKRLPQMIRLTGTTAANGELLLPSTVTSQNVLSARYTTGAGFVLYRNDGYVVCFDGNMQPKANTSVSIEVTYM